MGVKVDNLDRWQAWLKALEAKRVEQFKDRVLRSAGLRGLEYLHDLTPVRTGRLAGSFLVGDADNIYDIRVRGGKGMSYVRIGTAVTYAIPVNDGFQQQAGRYVPGVWRSGSFYYDREADTGMVLTGKYIPGAHMLEKTGQYLEEDIPKIIEFELRRLWAEVNGG